MSAEDRTPGDRAGRYAKEAEVVLRALALQKGGDLAWGLVQLLEDATDGLERTLEGNDMEAFDAASCRFAQVNAIISAATHVDGNDLIFASESLVEMAKEMIDAEHNRRMSVKAVQP